MSEHIASRQALDITEQATLALELPTAEVAIADTTAAFLAMPEAIDRPDATDLSVSEGAYRHLREQPDWTEVTDTTGVRLYNSRMGMSSTIGWQHASHDELAGRGWTTPSGLHVAGLPDVYTAQQLRGSARDQKTTAAIRARLQDPTGAPLPKRLLAYEIEQAQASLPEYLRDQAEARVAIHLAANALHSVSVQYGDGRIGLANQIIGDLELPEHGTPAMYHNGFDTATDLRMLQEHLTNVGATDNERLIAMVADAYSDSVYGNGRLSNNPEAYDELRSSRLAAGHARHLGMESQNVEHIRQAILGTTFSEATGTQLGRQSDDVVVRAVAGIDLQVLSEPGSVVASFDLAIEDGASARFSPARTLGKVAAEHGVRFTTTEQALEFVDANAGARPHDALDGPTVLEAVAARLKGNAGFHDPEIGYQPPHDWTLERPEVRRKHSEALVRIAGALASGEMTAREGYRQAHLHAQEIQSL